MSPLPRIVAHRGWPRRYPENTLVGLAAALAEGARWVEFDVQLSADGVPVVLHDAGLERTTGVSGSVHERSAAELAALRAGEPARFGDTHADQPIPTLARALTLLDEWPEACAFVELKRASMRRFGREQVVAATLPCLRELGPRAVPISFDAQALELVRAGRPGMPVGWVTERWDEGARELAAGLRPELLFVDRELLPPAPEPLWPGPWSWAVYTVDDPREARELAARGVAWIETDDIGAYHPAAERSDVR